MILSVENDGPQIVRTNYWSTDYARRGAIYVSVNAGTFRLLLPDAVAESVLPDLRTAREVIVSRGPWPAVRRTDAIELLFDDGSASPFALHLGTEQIDRLPAKADVGRSDLHCTVWIAGPGNTPQQVLDRPARYRLSRMLPDLRPWRGETK